MSIHTFIFIALFICTSVTMFIITFYDKDIKDDITILERIEFSVPCGFGIILAILPLYMTFLYGM